MELANKFLSNLKGLFHQQEDEDFIEDIKEALLFQINNKRIKAEKGFHYIPDYYQIFLSDSKQRDYIFENKYNKLIFDFINDKIKFANNQIRNKLELDFIVDGELESDLVVKSSFNVKPVNIDDTCDTGTMIYKQQKGKTKKFNNNDNTIKFKDCANNLDSHLIFLNDEKSAKRVKINSIETNLGRQRSNEIVLSDSSVSRVHAQIIKKKYYYLIKDLNSTNGVIVNGEYVREKILNKGDLILLGDVKLKFTLSS